MFFGFLRRKFGAIWMDGPQATQNASLRNVCITPGQACLHGRDPGANICAMKQADLGLNLSTKRTRKHEFLAQMERVVSWSALVQLVAPHAPEGKKGRPLFSVETMLRVPLSLN